MRQSSPTLVNAGAFLFFLGSGLVLAIIAIVFAVSAIRRDSATDAMIGAALGAGALVALGAAWIGILLVDVRSILLETLERGGRGPT
jgi:hypothetical protein